LATAIKGNHGGVRYLSLANRALRALIRRKGGALDVKPFVDARPAVQMATESDHWLVCKV
jgi:hypothetical protein